MKALLFTHLAALVMASIVLSGTAVASLPGMKVLRLQSPEPGPNRNFGSPCKLTDRYAVVSDSSIPSDLGIINQGRVRVYDAATGKLLRTLKASHPTTVTYFGRTLAVHGNLCLIGCYSEQVFLFDLNTGKQLRTFLNPGAPNNSFFGQMLQITERYAIIGHYGAAIYAYDLANDNPPMKITISSGSMYCYDNILLADEWDANNKGTVKRFDLATGQLLNVIQPPDGTVFDRFGHHINGNGQMAFVATDMGYNKAYPLTLSGQLGEPFNLDPEPPALFRRFMAIAMSGNLIAWWTAGDVVLSDLIQRRRLMVIKPADLGTDFNFSDISLDGNRMLIGAAYDDAAATDAGSAFLIQNVLDQLPSTPLASKSDSAPGAAGIAFNDLLSSAMNGAGRVAVSSSLSGTASNVGKDRAVFDDLAVAGILDLAVKSRDDLGAGVKIASVSSPVMNDSNALIPVTLSGTGVTSLNNRSLLRDNGSAVTTLLRTGQTLAPFGAATMSGFGQLAQSGTTSYFSSIVTLRSGVGGTTTANDSGFVLVRSDMPGTVEGEREGSASGISGVTFGQFTPRVSYRNGAAAFTAMLSGDATQNQAVFSRSAGGMPTLAARKGTAAIGFTGGTFSSFLAENVTPSGLVVFRAKVTGAGITSANNEGLWLGPPAMASLVARTGTQAPLMATGVVWSRFLQVCPQNNRMIIRALLRGTGITSANDEIVYLRQEDSSYIVLYREGQLLPGCNRARGAGISRLEADVDGSYGFITSVIGASSATNLVLYSGDTSKGTPTTESSLRTPELKLRKGIAYATGLSGKATLTSLGFANAQTQDSSGMSCKGLPKVTATSGLFVRLAFSDRSIQVMKIP